ncbi:MAG: metallophosphoesterase, partial [Eubacteriales bacterium]|nr:metallophosphoesterase [Eubacteriales bacterium]
GFSYNIEDFKRVVKICNEENPDIVIFSGDLIDDIKKYNEDLDLISDEMSRIDAPLGKYAVLGNHDYGSNGSSTYIDIMSSGGFEVLVNEHIFIEEYNIVIFGIDDYLIGYGNPDILTAASPDTCNIVICHEPDIADELTDYNVSVMLSGHTHGGQVYLPFYTKDFLPTYGKKYVRGLYEVGENGFPLYVTKGIGTTNLPFRLFSKPEVTIMTLNPLT